MKIINISNLANNAPKCFSIKNMNDNFCSNCNVCECCKCCCNTCCKKYKNSGECNICNIIDSIASIENSLAKILNAEGEKIQKAISITDNVCDLIEINKTVRDTIEYITELEHILYKKLKITLSAKDINN